LFRGSSADAGQGITREHVDDSGAANLILKAAEACPSVAITVVDAETGEQVSP
jgi:ferredoxin